MYSNQLPLIVHIATLTKFNKTSYCSGSRIDARTVVTAAHCFDQGWKSASISTKKFHTRKESKGLNWVIEVCNALGYEKITEKHFDLARSVSIEPDIYLASFNDISILTLRDPMPPPFFTVRTSPNVINETGYFFGFGLSDQPLIANQGPRVLIYNTIPCLSAAPSVTIDCFISHGLIKGIPCPGDSGGP